MQLPTSTVATGRVLHAGSHTIGRLNANKTAKVILANFAPQQKALKDANLALNDLEDELNIARGPVMEVDAEAMDMLTDLQLDAFKFVKKNYKDPLYIALLPKGLTGLRRLGGGELQTELKRIADRLKDVPKDHPLHAYHDKCAGLVKAYSEPLKSFDVAKTRLAKAVTGRTLARKAWLHAYEGVYGALRVLFPGRKAFVETFFVKFSKAAAATPANHAEATADASAIPA